MTSVYIVVSHDAYDHSYSVHYIHCVTETEDHARACYVGVDVSKGWKAGKILFKTDTQSAWNQPFNLFDDEPQDRHPCVEILEQWHDYGMGMRIHCSLASDHSNWSPRPLFCDNEAIVYIVVSCTQDDYSNPYSEHAIQCVTQDEEYARACCARVKEAGKLMFKTDTQCAWNQPLNLFGYCKDRHPCVEILEENVP